MPSIPCRFVLLTLVCLLAGTQSAIAVAPSAESVGQQREGVLFWSQAKRDADFRRMFRMFPSDLVAHGQRVHALPGGAPLVLPDHRDTQAWLADYMQRYHIAGVMIVQDGHVRMQRYALGFGPDQHWTSFSMAKSVTSILLGVALQQGYIHSMADPLDRYIPELRGTAYAKVTVRELLTMTTGVRWNEDYADAHSDVAQMYLGACVDHRAHVLSYLMRLPREWPAGTHWNYNTGEIDLLGILVQRATHRSLAAYLSQTIWKPYGMAADGHWLKDECDGSDTGGSGLSATLADYARLGEFMLGGTRIDGRPIAAKAWLARATRREAATDAPDRGYGYLWWTDADGSYAAIGIFGQMIYIDPARRLVIAQVASWPAATSDALVAGRQAFVATIKHAIDAGTTRAAR
ncbi:MAG TPA: serine hydrolase domain-containing protein [Rhodanobacteraceae bacterium]|nr:serine hydrolase domain-containing protein [Rhodanobacteraceae bacterium]